MSGHCASKFGLRGLIESTREEWRSLGVRLTNIFPGPVDTPLWNAIIGDEERKQMMDSEDFINAFDMVVKSAHHIHFPDVSLMHKEGTY